MAQSRLRRGFSTTFGMLGALAQASLPSTVALIANPDNANANPVANMGSLAVDVLSITKSTFDFWSELFRSGMYTNLTLKEGLWLSMHAIITVGGPAYTAIYLARSEYLAAAATTTGTVIAQEFGRVGLQYFASKRAVEPNVEEGRLASDRTNDDAPLLNPVRLG